MEQRLAREETPPQEDWKPIDMQSMMKEDLTVVLPTLNEAEGVGYVIDELQNEGYGKILVVDGYSSDRTTDIAKDKGATIIQQYGLGKAGAVRTAIDYVETSYMLVMDADYTYDPKDIHRMLTVAADSDCDQVIGMRKQENIPLIHRFGNRILSFCLSLLMGQRIIDPCSGIYLLRTDRARRLELSSTGFDVEAEIAGQVSSQGRINEVPVNYRKRKGKPKLRTTDGLRILLGIFRTMWLYNPLFFFSSLAALAAIPGAIILLEQLALRYLYGSPAWSTGWTWLGLLLFMVGLQGLAVATTSLLLRRMERRILRKVI